MKNINAESSDRSVVKEVSLGELVLSLSLAVLVVSKK